MGNGYYIATLPTSGNKAMQMHWVHRCEHSVFLLHVLLSNTTNHAELNFPSFLYPTEESKATKFLLADGSENLLCSTCKEVLTLF
jgi:hypothetical protein